jgi:tetratricopeptide (TPR) repeat protein
MRRAISADRFRRSASVYANALRRCLRRGSRHDSRHGSRHGSLLAFALVVVVLCACQTGDRPSLATASSAYRAAEFGRTVTLARDVAARSDGLERSRARYLEGIALLALGRAAEAVAPLEAAADAPDRRLAADARVSLGTAQIELDQFGRAADSYRRAASLLENDERARALEIEAALRECVRGTQGVERVSTRESERPAEVSTRPGPEASSVQEAPKPSSPTAVIVNGIEIEPLRFAIQAGAFRERNRADLLAQELRTRVAVERLSAPRVFEKSRPDGGVVYVVQFGNFENRTLAGKALLAFTRSGYTVERSLGP